MARNSAVGGVLRCSTILAFLFTLSASINPFDFYKLAIQWPKSYCNTGSVTCTMPIKTYFTIHGLWPQYNPDTSVAPFNQTGCTMVNPTPRGGITLALLNPMLSEMTTYWPNLRGYNSNQRNLGFWQYQWAQHGMCSAYPTQPLLYFNEAILKIKTYNMGQILRNTVVPPILPSNRQTYNRTDISNAIRGAVGARPEIHCNRDSANVVQLMEVRICLDKLRIPINCPRAYTACPVQNLVRYPTP